MIWIAGAEDPHVLRGRFHLNKNRGLIFARLKIGDDRGGEQNQKKREEDQHPANADDSPVVEKVQFAFFSM